MTRSDPSQESVRFVWFDFHQECKNMRYDKLSKLAGMTEREVREGEWAFRGRFIQVFRVRPVPRGGDETAVAGDPHELHRLSRS